MGFNKDRVEKPQLESAAKANRLPKACDSCSLRKVKCDEEQPCKACRVLDIPCTFQRPSRRRGPPNRLAEALKREYRNSGRLSPSSPTSPGPNPLPTPPQTKKSLSISAESICPLDLLELLIDDFFTFVYPLEPFPHEQWFRQEYRARRDLHDPLFLALLAGMIGSVISCFPRSARNGMISLGREDLFNNGIDFVKRCQQVAVEARGPGYLERTDLNVHDAATSYYLAVMSLCTKQRTAARLYVSECYSIVRVLLARNTIEPESLGSKAERGNAQTVNFIEEETLNRLFWICFVGMRSVRPLGLDLGELKPPTPTYAYPPLPREVDDEFIHPTHIEAQPPGVLARVTGFNINVRIYLTFDPLVAMETSYSIDQVFDWERQKHVLRDCLKRIRHCFDDVPEQLLVWHGPPSRSPSAPIKAKHEPADDYASVHSHQYYLLSKSLEQRRQITYEIQKANIHVSYLSSRSYFIEKYWNLCHTQFDPSSGEEPPPLIRSDTGEVAINTERQSVANDLLQVLCSIRPIHMEPNSESFILKIRQIASTLLPSPETARRASVSSSSAQYLQSFLEILVDLERYERQTHWEDGEDDLPLEEKSDVDKENDFPGWANLREQQRHFAKGNVVSKTLS